jgi:hypothetical protein
MLKLFYWNERKSSKRNFGKFDMSNECRTISEWRTGGQMSDKVERSQDVRRGQNYLTSANKIGALDKDKSIGRSQTKSKCRMRSEIWIAEQNQLSKDREVLLERVLRIWEQLDGS